MPVTRLNNQGKRPGHQYSAELEDPFQATRLLEHFGVGGNPNDTAQDLGRQSETPVTVRNAIKPLATKGMVGGIGPEGMNQDVDIRENHDLSMTSSRSAHRSRSTPGKTPPEALDTGSRTLFLVSPFGDESMMVRPASINDVKVRPSAVARFLALRSRSSLSRTVVLMSRNLHN